MQQFEHLLVGLKLDKLDVTTLEYASMIARHAGSKRVSLVHVEEALELPDSAREQYPELGETPAEVAEKQMRERAVNHFKRRADTRLDYEVAYGSPANELLQHVVLHGIDLAIVGDAANKRDGGTVPERLARKAPCSVLIVPEGSKPEFHKILVPIDFSEHSADALKTAAECARTVGCQVINCVHTFSVPPVSLRVGKSHEELSDAMKGHAEDAYRAFVKGIDLSGLQVTTTFVADQRPEHAIEKEIERDKPSVVVMGARGRTNAAAIFLGSVTERVIRRTNVPLLAVKKKGERLEFLEGLLTL